jgi:hypothetical protein
MRWLGLSVVGLALAIVCFAFGYTRALSRADVLEFKLVYGDLSYDLSDSPRLREFLKARYYYLAQDVPDGIFMGYVKDFGPVDNKILDGLPVVKSDISKFDGVYAEFLRRKLALESGKRIGGVSVPSTNQVPVHSPP